MTHYIPGDLKLTARQSGSWHFW